MKRSRNENHTRPPFKEIEYPFLYLRNQPESHATPPEIPLLPTSIATDFKSLQEQYIIP